MERLLSTPGIDVNIKNEVIHVVLLDDYIIWLCIGNSFHDAFKLKGYVKEPTFQGQGNCPMSIFYWKFFFCCCNF